MSSFKIEVERVEYLRDNQSKIINFNVSNGRDTIPMTKTAAENLRSKLTAMLNIDNPTLQSAKEKQRKARAYANRWLELEITKLLHEERYEDVEALKYITKAVKEYSKQKRFLTKSVERVAS